MRRLTVLAVACTILLAPPWGSATAQPPDPALARPAFLLQATVPDMDFFLLTELVGFDRGTVDYRFDIDASLSAWSALLTGDYLGQTVAVAYSGDASPLPAGATAAWTSTGTYGTAQWSGAGSAVFRDLPSGFLIELEAALTIGTTTASLEADITAADTETTTTYVDTVGTLTIDGLVQGAPFFSLTGERVPRTLSELVAVLARLALRRQLVHENDIQVPHPFGGRKLIIKSVQTTEFSFPTPDDGRCCVGTNTLSTVPAPSALDLVAVGSVVLAVTAALRRRHGRSSDA
jgi:hypothetical protein